MSIMTDSNHTASCYANTSTPYSYSPGINKVDYSATFSTLGLISNLIAFIVLIKSFKQTKNHSRSFFLIFLGGLVVTDFMGLLVTGSFVISFYVTRVDWSKSDPACHFCNFMGMSMVFYGLSPLLLGATMATQRFIGINHPFASSSKMTKRRTTSMMLMVWFIAGSISLLPLVGFGSYHIQTPGSWCFLNMTPKTSDWGFALLFSLVGLISIATSILLNTVSVVTLLKVYCGAERRQRSRDHEAEMMLQLILIMTIATVCWCPLLVFIAQTAFARTGFEVKYLLLCIRFATWNQILDPWVYILFRRSVLRRVNPRSDWSRTSIISSSSTIRDNVHRFARSSLGSNLRTDVPEDPEKSNVMPPSPITPSSPSPCLIGSE
ncbi:thromboxane A2 receptor isoform X1 [Xiphophorus maculatus]|uniref:Thromboxane A2 receptor n=1 Tax=Xiphophorus maculatus TaxID=8083 RepID=A0A3B5QC85_XIPMA|nr:thromboxane A2 receptor isoform X1 [Xiphophorus maculatus]XP_023195974.1 thromboxane A2 receptor isoform X1 [Xiphophorus maculatus]XP_023195976.1 thromboxane A2 receptor isoform X1 [Xiphophorus maculatus]